MRSPSQQSLLTRSERSHMNNKSLFLSLVATLVLAGTNSLIAQKNPSLANIEHLVHLTAPMNVEGENVTGIAIYADAPDFDHADAPEEGFTCVDDAARAAVVLLDYARNRGTKEHQALAKGLLRFVLQLQGGDGLFWNFAYRDGTINRFGKTSKKSYDFWTSRGLWALGRGAEDFAKSDPPFARRCTIAARKTMAALKRRVDKHQGTTRIGERTFPDILLLCGTDCWSEALLGLVALQRAAPSDECEKLIRVIAGALTLCRGGTKVCPPFGAFSVSARRPWIWHGWGSRTALALIEASELLYEEQWIQLAEAEVNTLHAHLLSCGMLAAIDPHPAEFPQIAYTLAPLIQSAAALARRQGPYASTYAKYAGFLGAWFFGANKAKTAIYSPLTGRCLDGIDVSVDEKTSEFHYNVNKNSGAESTIEALFAMLALEATPQTRSYLQARPLHQSCRVVLLQPKDGWSSPFKFSVPTSKRYTFCACFHSGSTRRTEVYLDGSIVGRLPVKYSAGPRVVIEQFLKAGEHELHLSRAANELEWWTIVESAPSSLWILDGNDGKSRKIQVTGSDH